MMGKQIPVVDLFAGAGGFGEGFASLKDRSEKPVFDVCFSVEKDASAHSTLLLRKFFRSFSDGSVPEAYYDCVRGRISTEQLYADFPTEYGTASNAVWLAELGSAPEVNNQLSRRIRAAVGKAEHWVLTGGPPCQTFSIASKRRRTAIGREMLASDPRTFLYTEYLKVIAEHFPSVFVLENVKGLISSKVKEKSIFGEMIEQLRNPLKVLTPTSGKTLGYSLFQLTHQKNHQMYEETFRPDDFIVESEYYGIPQRRHRVIILGVRNDLLPLEIPRLEPQATVPLDDILNSLPSLRSGLTRQQDTPEAWKRAVSSATKSEWFKKLAATPQRGIADRIEHIARTVKPPDQDRGKAFIPGMANLSNGFHSWYKDDRLGGVIQHVSRSHMVSDLHRYLFAACFAQDTGVSPTLSLFPSDLLPNHKNAGGYEFCDRFRVQVYGKPSSTIMSHMGKDGHYYIHPDPLQCRSLTVREAARLQTFPDNFYFCGINTSKFSQIGNAVPPLLASKIAGIVAQIIGIRK